MTEPTPDNATNAAPTPPSPPPAKPVVGPDLARNLDMLLVTYVAFLLGLITAGFGAIVGVVIAYLKRPEVAGTWRESHYTWLIRTFWIGLLFSAIGGITALFFIGFLVVIATFVWFIIRLVKGWMSYSNEEAIQNPDDWFLG